MATTYTITVNREELGVLLDALATWPPSNKREAEALENMSTTLWGLYDGTGPGDAESPAP